MARVITTKFFGPTNSKGSRVQVKTCMKTHYVSWDHALNSEENHSVAVAEVLMYMNRERDGDYAWSIIGGGMMPDDSGYGFVVELS